MTRSSIPWPRLAAEAVAIVASILLAFGIDAWWDARVERAREQVIIGDLATEFERNRALLRTMLEGHEERAEIALRLHAIATGAREPPSAAVLDSLVFRSLIQAGSYNPARGVYSAIHASGDAGLIRDDSLRYALAAWPGTLEDALEEEQWIFRDVQDHVTPYLASRIPLAPALQTDGATEVTFLGSSVDGDYSALLGDVAFQNFLAIKGWNESFAAVELRETEAVIEDILRLLKKNTR